MVATCAAVALSLALAAAISSGEGISGAAGTRTAGTWMQAGGAACAGRRSVPKSATAAHSAAVFRPEPVQVMGKPRCSVGLERASADSGARNARLIPQHGRGYVPMATLATLVTSIT